MRAHIYLPLLCLLYGSVRPFQSRLFFPAFFIIMLGKELPGINQNHTVNNDKELA